MVQKDGKIKAEPAAGVWGRRIAQVSKPAATSPGWLYLEKSSHFRRAASQPSFALPFSRERR
jgi:hypothetical protein